MGIYRSCQFYMESAPILFRLLQFRNVLKLYISKLDEQYVYRLFPFCLRLICTYVYSKEVKMYPVTLISEAYRHATTRDSQKLPSLWRGWNPEITRVTFSSLYRGYDISIGIELIRVLCVKKYILFKYYSRTCELKYVYEHEVPAEIDANKENQTRSVWYMRLRENIYFLFVDKNPTGWVKFYIYTRTVIDNANIRYWYVPNFRRFRNGRNMWRIVQVRRCTPKNHKSV